MFAQHGYAHGTTNRIAERADISIGSLYQYYPNKDAILIELAGRHLDAGVAATADRLKAGAIASVEDAIRDIVVATIDNHRQDPEFLRVLIEQAPRTHQLMAKVAERQQESVQAMKKLLAGQHEVVVDDKDAAARLVVLTIESVVHQAMAAPQDLAPMPCRQNWSPCSRGTSPANPDRRRSTGVDEPPFYVSAP